MRSIFLGTDSGLSSVWSHPSVLIWCAGVSGSGASKVCCFLSVTQPHRELMPPALISQSEEGDWLFNCSCCFKTLVFCWLYNTNGKLPWQIKNHLRRFLLCFWCVIAWARVSLHKGLGPQMLLPATPPSMTLKETPSCWASSFSFWKWEAWKWGSWKAVLAFNIKMMKCYVSAYFTEISHLEKGPLEHI